MSWSHADNKPSGKSTQIYYWMHPWEPKHIIGKNGVKLAEFMSHPGVTNITSSRYRSANCACWFKIDGQPQAVDETMLKMSEWLQECQRMYHE